MELLLHPATAQDLKQLLAKPAHAIGVFGLNGAGKSAVVAHIASGVLGVTSLSDSPAVHSIDAGEGDGIEQVRGIRSFLSLKTAGTALIRRVVVIEQAELLSKDAQNALLKTLEEPPTDTMIVLTASDKAHLLPTILSRLRSVRVLPLTKDQCLGLGTHSPAELQKAYNLSGGLAGLFVGLLESGSEHTMSQAVESAKEFLSQQPYERLTQLDIYTKDKQLTKQLVMGLQVCLHAALRTTRPDAVKNFHKKLETVSFAERRLAHNVQAKLVLTSLATQL